MSIQEQPTMNLVDLQLYVPVTGFILNQSKLGRTNLAPAGAMRWVSYIGEATNISITRGAKTDGVGFSNQVGTLTASFFNAANPLTHPEIKPKVGIRLVHRASGAALFTGIILDINTVHQIDKKTGQFKDYVTLSAVDAVQALANTTRFGATVQPQSFADRINALIQSSPFHIDAISGTTPYQLGGTVFEGSLAAHFDMACNSVGALWKVDASGQVGFGRPNVTDQTVLGTFAEVKNTLYPNANTLYFIDIDTAYDTRSMVNDLTLNQHDTKTESDGTVNADDTTLNYKAAQSVADYGSRAGSIDVSLYSQADLDARAKEVLDKYSTPRVRATQMRWNVADRPSEVYKMELGAQYQVDFRNTSTIYRIVNINHEITPERWIVTLGITPWR